MQLKKFHNRFLILVIFIISLIGCRTRPVALVPSNVPIVQGSSTATRAIRGTVPGFGDSCQISLLGLIPLFAPASTQKALTEAKEDAGSVVLTDITVDESYYYYVILGQRCIHVEGLGVKKL